MSGRQKHVPPSDPRTDRVLRWLGLSKRTSAAALEPELVRADLQALWLSMFETQPALLREDLVRLGEWFDGPSARRLREKLAGLKPVSVSSGTLSIEPPVALLAGQRAVMTPEGRVILELLRTDVECELSDKELNQVLLELYRGWTFRSVASVIDAGEGRRGRMKLVSLGFVLVLLAHGSESETDALHLTGNESAAVEQDLKRPLLALKRQLGEAPRLSDPFDGFPLTHARPRLGSALRREPSKGKPARIWIEGRQRQQAIEILADELVSVRGLTAADATQAVDAVLAEYDEIAPSLATAGLKPVSNSRAPLREELVRAINQASGQ